MSWEAAERVSCPVWNRCTKTAPSRWSRTCCARKVTIYSRPIFPIRSTAAGKIACWPNIRWRNKVQGSEVHGSGLPGCLSDLKQTRNPARWRVLSKRWRSRKSGKRKGNRDPRILNLWTVNPLTFEPWTLNPEPWIFQPWTQNPEPRTLNLWTQNLEPILLKFWPECKFRLHFFLAFLNFVIYSTGWILIETGGSFNHRWQTV